MIKEVNMKKKYNLSTKKTRQKGVVLIVSLVFLVALTAVAAALMQNSTTDMKMAGASEEKAVALQEAYSGVDEVIFNQVNSMNSRFTRSVTGEDNFPVNDQDILLPGTLTGTTAVVDAVNNGFNLDVGCPRAKLASSEGDFGCSLIRVTVTRNYGRNTQSVISIETGIAQQIPK